jgi:hypothetical protein
MSLTIKKADPIKNKPDDHHLGFGTHFTDHMFNMDYAPRKGVAYPAHRTLWTDRHGSGHDGPALRDRGYLKG